MSFRLGVDIGGTFTDFCLLDEDTGELHTCKVLSTPNDPGAEVLAGLIELERRYGIDPREIRYFTHGTTVGVNTILQRNGMKLCLWVTKNFEDVLEVARLKMPDPYDLFSRRPVPLVPRERVFGVEERILANGQVAVPVDEMSLRTALAEVRDIGGEGVVISLLHAYRNPAHERAIRAFLDQQAPHLAVSCSSDVWPIIREYERTVTAVVAGYAQPRITHYLESLERALDNAGVPALPLVTKSNGGVMTAKLAKQACAQALLSGTAAGVIGASHVAKVTHSLDTLSLDIGGTSADVALIRGGEPQYGVGELIGEFPIFIPTVSVTSIGEGGGSIAWVDDFGVLKVGPESAGSTPGPACYGRGGTRATITDAFVVCGFLGQSSLGYSAVDLDRDGARVAIGSLSARIDRSIEETAAAIIEVAVSGMYLEVSKLLSRYGVDATDLTLQAFGGAGPMMASFFARELGMRTMVIPTTPGVLSAFGGLIADIKGDFIRTVLLDLTEASQETLNLVLEELSDEASIWLEEACVATQGPRELRVGADMRYRGQSFEIDTDLEQSWIRSGDLHAIATAFHLEHERLYGHSDVDAAIQIVNLRVVAVSAVPKPASAPLACATTAAEPTRTAKLWIDGEYHAGAIYDRTHLRAGHCIHGPAVIEQADCTTCLLPGSSARVDGNGNLIVTLGGATQ